MATEQVPEQASKGRAMARRMFQVLGNLALIGILLFVAAGQPAWLWAWVYLGAGLALLVLNAIILLPRHGDLVSERGEIREGTKGWDRAMIPVLLLTGLSMYVVAGLDERFGWSPDLPLWLHLLALVVMVMAQLGFVWAMSVNRFFAKTVRIQAERGHTVVSSGPYRFVRHPGYLCNLVTFPMAMLLLGSLWGLIAAAASAAAFIIRTALEDRTLQQELPGYRDYAQRVRYRLFPGIW
ncbi:MAG: isoprenylcysteine carboxylmethyltransferase family protein [Anaerolineae bacterium]|nr:isoprenylcysteine carboxylmethyltransferase family protein [Anaerolineae bacterium]